MPLSDAEPSICEFTILDISEVMSDSDLRFQIFQTPLTNEDRMETADSSFTRFSNHLVHVWKVYFIIPFSICLICFFRRDKDGKWILFRDWSFVTPFLFPHICKCIPVRKSTFIWLSALSACSAFGFDLLSSNENLGHRLTLPQTTRRSPQALTARGRRTCLMGRRYRHGDLDAWINRVGSPSRVFQSGRKWTFHHQFQGALSLKDPPFWTFFRQTRREPPPILIFFFFILRQVVEIDISSGK
jgi:hypothetical protein